MNIKIVVNKAEEGGFWGQVPSMPGCYSQGETIDELMLNIREAIELWQEVALEEIEVPTNADLMELEI
jgi:predicted RNase H-like HicB family nuclease